MGKRALGPDPMSWGRVLHLVRHGQYESRHGVFGGTLTPVGRRQARRTGAALKTFPIAAIHSSDYNRAVETADIIASGLGLESVQRHRILREIQPTRVPGWKVALDERRNAQIAVERVVRRFFRPSRQPRHEVIVCHGNLIRFIFARQLNAPKMAWMKLGTHHCGVTQVVVVGSRPILLTYNSIGHLTPALQTCR